VQDPPHLAKMRERVGPVDYIGLGLIALGLGSLEVVLDTGQQKDWFASRTITLYAVTAAVALITFVIWEWRHRHPIVEVRMFRDRNFAVSNLMMLVLGMALYGSTVLLPQYVQVLMGWSAQDAGMALSPGGVTVICLLPLVGRLISRVDARYLIAFGFTALSVALYHMSRTIYPGMDFHTAMMLRIYQSVGIAFLFVPINTIAYTGIPPSKSNQVSGIINLSRNMGGDIGISMVTTLIARRSQWHQGNLVANVRPGEPLLLDRLQGIAQSLQHAGVSAVQSTKLATAAIYRQVIQQAQTLAYLDVLFVLACFTAVMVPLVLLTRRAARGPTMGH